MASLCSCAVTNLPCNGSRLEDEAISCHLHTRKEKPFCQSCVFILGSGSCPLTSRVQGWARRGGGKIIVLKAILQRSAGLEKSHGKRLNRGFII
ncbi:hypothetical protein CDAR_7851 [Caerostris darwini]|uniref:Uncharacterized protein n=1 Tax=Caerostris darwini TaxID=1538125 RepID=A0AAV4Q7Y4_9ARAC|nr:hypothetical protein CDAR_7851 [Caerostris darwini]